MVMRRFEVVLPVMAAVQRVALQLPPRRAAKTVKMHTISRAEGGQLQAPVGRRPRYNIAPAVISMSLLAPCQAWRGISD